VIAIERQVTNNGGKSLKDAVDRIETASEKAAEMATAAKTALDEHVAQSSKLIEQGAKDKAAIEARQAKQDQTIATLAHAVDIAAQSTPPHEETP
jgi:ABC-type transporter Mla subunit MlaD